MKTTIVAVILIMFAWAKLEPASCMDRLLADSENSPAVAAVQAPAAPTVDLASVMNVLKRETGTKKASPAAALPSRAIFGKDDRQELFSAPVQWKEIGHSLAGKVSVDHITDHGSSWELHGDPLSAKECPGNRFSDQITVPSCTGFLLKPDLLVTAAHCIKAQDDCDNFKWVFEYALANQGDKNYTKVGADRVYQCKKIVARNYQNFGDIDYAILQLDRPVEGRKPLKLALNSQPAVGTGLVNIGNSNGLPLKYKDSAQILHIKPTGQAFDSEMDTFGGDSGSPVFDAATGEVLGITSSGHADHFHDGASNCRQLKVCKPGEKCNLSVASGIWNLKSEPALGAN
ncbi:MAG: trypsin-like peptidase domain-containing protein [Elusimicrobia bacterium]|nr:trypsin-like peptidase domain-containing protein [Elusimicrobiota bacterium]